MRKGEILRVKWTDIDFKNNVIYLLDTKNGDKKEVLINDMVKRALIQQPKYKDGPYAFCNRDGRPFRDIRKSFIAALKKSGIINFRFHDLRHTFASQLVMSGVDLNTVRELMGHKSIRMTLRYAHLSPAHKKRAVDVLGQKWSLDGPKRLQETSAVNDNPENSLSLKGFSEVPR
jgi:integrase